MLERIEQVLMIEKPHWTLVYGDTNSTLAGALAAAKLHIPVAHVEAGLRSWNRTMPEEINRVLTDHSSTLLFAPTSTAVQNLYREGISGNLVKLVGDVMYDAALFYGQQAEVSSDILTRYSLRSKEYVLATIHRAENTTEVSRLQAILGGLASIAPKLRVIVPLHPVPRRSISTHRELERDSASLQVTPPVGYLDMVKLEKHARLIATDSGGVQKESFFYGVPCITLREETEWVELLQLGCNRLAPPTSAEAINSRSKKGLNDKPTTSQSPYGDGKSAPRIAELLLS